MKKRLMTALAAGALLTAMVPAVSLATDVGTTYSLGAICTATGGTAVTNTYGSACLGLDTTSSLWSTWNQVCEAEGGNPERPLGYWECFFPVN